MTEILSCNCRHEQQDAMYGKGRRVHNKCQKDPKANKYRCTVCGTEHVHVKAAEVAAA